MLRWCLATLLFLCACGSPPPTPEAKPAPPPAASRAVEVAPPPPKVAAPAPSPEPPPAPAPKAETPKAAPAKPEPAKPAPPKAAPLKPAPAPAPPPAAAATPPPLDLKALEARLKNTDAIGVLTKLSLKNQVDDLIGRFRNFHAGQRPPTLTDLRPAFDLLLMKVLTLLQDADKPLANDIHQSREALWSVLADRDKLQSL